MVGRAASVLWGSLWRVKGSNAVSDQKLTDRPSGQIVTSGIRVIAVVGDEERFMAAVDGSVDWLQVQVQKPLTLGDGFQTRGETAPRIVLIELDRQRKGDDKCLKATLHRQGAKAAQSPRHLVPAAGYLRGVISLEDVGPESGMGV